MEKNMFASGPSSSSLQNLQSYSNERQSSLDVEIANDPSSGGFFNADFKKHDDLKQMLDSNKDSLKLEAMKRIIGMVAKGRDASDLFPAVVKNVVSKNIEVKKLVYVYLVRYAEEQQDLALLSISTFQRALKDPNQLIRASALRVLSSIRVSMIVPIVMLAIRNSSSDMSPYVRKTAAHAIPKLYFLDPEQKEELITVIEKLLSDRTTLVVGSAVMAFEEVCPERADLIHKNYRKLCNLLVDVDEWGQVIIVNMLTRYARTQFINPNNNDYMDQAREKQFYDETSSESDSNSTKPVKSPQKTVYALDGDHRLLLRQTKPLLQSRNASVVMTVAQLYHHIAPQCEVVIVAKALIRLLRGHIEVQSVVLTCIASMSTQRKCIFQPFMKSFFVRTSDPTHIKLLKLEILTNLASEKSISIILREFQTYINSNDKEFVAATIQAIGRCSSTIEEVTETCLNGLVHLLSNRDEYVVAESVVVIKKLLQTQVADHFEIISKMAKLLDFITVPAARASILWLIGEYNEKVKNIGPDVLRKMAKAFPDEQDIVKLQILNLSVKLHITNPLQTDIFSQYIFNLARYDQNFDIRDRARFLKQFIYPANGKDTILSKNARNVFMAPKPAPQLECKYSGREQFQLGSLSHYLNIRANGYNDLPNFPDVAPDSSQRNVVELDSHAISVQKNDDNITITRNSKNPKSFYSESEKDSSEYSKYGSESETEDESSQKKDDESEDHSTESESSSTTYSESKCTDSSSSAGDDNDSISSDESEGHVNDADGTNKIDLSVFQNIKKRNNITKNNKPINDLDLLLDMDEMVTNTALMTPSFGGFPISKSNEFRVSSNNNIEIIGPSLIPINSIELLNKVNGYGLSINYRFTRAPLQFLSMVSIELLFTNHSHNDVIEQIEIGDYNLPSGMHLHPFATIARLEPQSTSQGTIGIDFNDSLQTISFYIKSSMGKSKVSIKSSVGELVQSIRISEEVFKEERTKLRGMNEHCSILPNSTLYTNIAHIRQRIFEVANIANIFSTMDTLYLAGQTLSSKSLILIVIGLSDTKNISITVNCEKFIIGSMLLNELKAALSG